MRSNQLCPEGIIAGGASLAGSHSGAAEHPGPASSVFAHCLPPEGHIVAPTASLWFEAVEYIVSDSGRRSDWQRRARRLAWQLLQRTSRNMVTNPRQGATWAILAAELRVSRRTVAALIAWLITHGLLHRVRPGTTRRYRPGTLAGLIHDGRGNEAAQYQLIIPLDLLDYESLSDEPVPVDEVPWPCETVRPRNAQRRPLQEEPVDESFTPNPSPTSLGENPPHPPRARGSAPKARASLWPAAVAPSTRADRLRACERLRQELPALARISTRHLRSLLRLAFSLKATIDDIRHALDVKPDGAMWIHTDVQRWIPGWVRSRLAAWIASDGRLLVAWPSQQRAAAVLRAKAERAVLLRDRVRLNGFDEFNQHTAMRGAARARKLLLKRREQDSPLDMPEDITV